MSFYGLKKEPCTDCGHSKVCSIKNICLKIRKDIDNISISTGKNTLKDLKNFDEFEVVIKCKHWIENKSFREGVR